MNRISSRLVLFTVLLCAGRASSAFGVACNIPEPGNCFFEGVIVDCSLCDSEPVAPAADPPTPIYNQQMASIDQSGQATGTGGTASRFCNALSSGGAYRRNSGSACIPVSASAGCSSGGCVAVTDARNCRSLLTAFCPGGSPAAESGKSSLDTLAEKVTKENAARASRIAEESTGSQSASRKEASTIKITAAIASATMGALYCAEGANLAVEKGSPATKELARCRDLVEGAKGLAGNAFGADTGLLSDPAASDVLGRFEEKFGVSGHAYLKAFLGSRGAPGSLAQITQGNLESSGGSTVSAPPNRAPSSTSAQARQAYAEQLQAAMAAAKSAGIGGLDRFTVSEARSQPPKVADESPGLPTSFSLSEAEADTDRADLRAMRGLMRATLDRRALAPEDGLYDASLFQRVSSRYRSFREELRKK